MRWPARIVARGRSVSAERAYHRARALAAKARTPQPASWWGLCAMLSSYHLHRATLRPLAELWPELLPFLHIPNEALAMSAVEEYLVYLEDPVLADKQWLGIQIDDALAHVDRYDAAVAELLENPESGVRGQVDGPAELPDPAPRPPRGCALRRAAASSRPCHVLARRGGAGRGRLGPGGDRRHNRQETAAPTDRVSPDWSTSCPPGTPAACGCATGGAACGAPWLRFAGSARGSPRNSGRPPRGCARCRRPRRSAS